VRLVLFTGKGGTGKSTLASAYALKLAEHERVLLVSLDPAHSLSEILGTPVGSGRFVTERLKAVELEPELEKRRFLERVKTVAKTVLSTDRYLKLLEKAVEGPGAYEVLALEALSRLLYENRNAFSAAVLDMAPSGHALLTLREAVRVSSFLKELIKLRGKLELLKRAGGLNPGSATELLSERAERLSFLETLLREGTVNLVSTPDALALSEARQSLKSLREEGFTVRTLYLNKALKPVKFEGLEVKVVPPLEEEPLGLGKLELLKPYL